MMKIDPSQDLGLKKSNGPTTNALARVQSSSLSRKMIGSQSIDVASLIEKQGIQKQMLHFKAVVSKETGYDLC